MITNISNVQGGLGSGIQQDIYSQVGSVYPYTIVPLATDECTVGSEPIPVVQTMQPTWVINPLRTPYYIQSQQLQWNINFQGTSNNYYQGQSICFFDVPRCPILVFSVAIDNACTATINAWDELGRVVVSEFSVAQGATIVTAPKSMMIIQSVFFSSYPWAAQADSNTVQVQGSSKFSLPYLVTNPGYIYSVAWDDTVLAPNTVLVPGSIWRSSANNVSFTSGDARGLINLTSQGSQPDGTIPLTLLMYSYGQDQTIDNQLTNYANYSAINKATHPVNYSLDKQFFSAPGVANVSLTTSL